MNWPWCGDPHARTLTSLSVASPSPVRSIPGGIALVVRVTPNAGVDQIEGVDIRDNGEAVLKLRVAAVPDRGKANAAVIALVSRALGVPKSACSVTSGDTSRTKTLHIAGDPQPLLAAAARLTG